jgi:hypothetical protein
MGCPIGFAAVGDIHTVPDGTSDQTAENRSTEHTGSIGVKGGRDQAAGRSTTRPANDGLLILFPGSTGTGRKYECNEKDW